MAHAPNPQPREDGSTAPSPGTRERLHALLEAGREVSNTLDTSVVLRVLAHHVRRAIGAGQCIVFLHDERERVLRPAVCDSEVNADEYMQMRLHFGEGVTGAVAASARAEIVNDPAADPRVCALLARPTLPQAMMCVPLVSRDRVLGVITLMRFEGEGFTPEDLEYGTLFAGQCSAALANARLYQNLRSAYQEMRSTQAQLLQSAKLHALGQLAGGVAHDFNNLLSAILGRTQLLLRGCPDDEMRRQLEVIEQAALDGAQTVRRVQEFTRVRQDERIELLDLSAVAADAVELTRPVWDAGSQKRGVPIELLLDLRSTRRVAGSGAELREVLTNLILNAVDAMPEGGTLTVSSEEGAGRVSLCVRDTGVGMDEATCSRIFEPFFTTKSSRGGGLGLSVAYGIVQRHKGTVEVHSQPGRGSSFALSFPVANGDPVTAPPVQTDAGSLPLEVLVVDDERVVLDVLAEMLRSLGHRVTPALGGHAACEALRKGRYDVVFSDLGMPEVTGWDVAAEARREDHTRAFVLVSGWGHQLEPAEVAERGVDRVLPKPFSLDEVREAIGGLFVGERRSA